jgi:hypothetical protein
MAAGFNPKDNRENDLIGNILSDGKESYLALNSPIR